MEYATQPGQEDISKTNSLKKSLTKNYNKEGVHTSRFIFLGIGCLIFLLILCSGSYFAFKHFTKEVKKEAQQALPWSTDTQKDEDKFEEPKKTNTSVIVGKVQWKVIETKEQQKIAEKEGCEASEGNKLIYLKLTVKNLDRAFVTVPKSAIDIYDEDKIVYSISNNKTFNCLGDQKYNLKDKYIPPILKLDEEQTFEFIYEVPKDAGRLRLKAGDLSTIGREFEYIELAL